MSSAAQECDDQVDHRQPCPDQQDGILHAEPFQYGRRPGVGRPVGNALARGTVSVDQDNAQRLMCTPEEMNGRQGAAGAAADNDDGLHSIR
jgi:hypothetical protein